MGIADNKESLEKYRKWIGFKKEEKEEEEEREQEKATIHVVDATKLFWQVRPHPLL